MTMATRCPGCLVLLSQPCERVGKSHQQRSAQLPQAIEQDAPWPWDLGRQIHIGHSENVAPEAMPWNAVIRYMAP